MRGLYTAGQIHAAEQRMQAELTNGVLMQRAATALAYQCAACLRADGLKIYGASVVLLVGTGSNGGDALYAGAQLLRRGAAVVAVLVDSTRRHKNGRAAFAAAGGKVIRAEQTEAIPLIQSADLVIDGVLGIGGRPGLSDLVRGLFRAAADVLTVAVDVPSGVNADTGVADDGAARADVTVTFGGLKAGLLVGRGAELSGEVILVDIGLALGLGHELGGDHARPDESNTTVLEDKDIARLMPHPAVADDKYRRGVVGIVAGSEQYPGAGVLAVGSARRGGAGMVRLLGSSPSVAAQVLAHYPDVIMHRDATVADLRVQAWVVGPGIGLGERSRTVLREVLATDVPVLVDADAITLMAEELAINPGVLRQRNAPTVLTPHDREFERIAGPVGQDRIETARQAAQSLGATVLLKGFATVIADPDGQVFVNPTGSPWLATAGSGDVLSGLIGSLLAAGLAPTHAATVGAYLHGVAGQLAAVQGPPTAVEILAALPGATSRVRTHDRVRGGAPYSVSRSGSRSSMSTQYR